MKVLLFAGTGEGRELSTRLREKKIEHVICVATDYGAELLQGFENVKIGRMSKGDMIETMRENFTHVIDATHPYARVVTELIDEAAHEVGLPKFRLLRKSGETENGIIVQNTDEAVEFLKKTEGNILLTTGSKELISYRELADRIFPRVLPFMDSLQKCTECKVPSKQIICMQGPFSRAMNEATIEQFGIKILVTKDTGDAGGFADKIEAAENKNCMVVIIGRPSVESGFTMEEIEEKLSKECVI